MKNDDRVGQAGVGRGQDKEPPNRMISFEEGAPRRFAPLRFLLILCVSVFFVEALIMAFLSILPPLSFRAEMFLDALLLTIFVFPILYLFSFRPLMQHIEHHRKAEEKLQKLNYFHQTLLNTIPFCLDIVDENGTILYANAHLQRLTGDGWKGKKCWDVYKDDGKRCDRCPLKEGVRVGETKILETEGCFGGMAFQIVHTGMIYEGRLAVLEIFQDITERKHLEALKDEFINTVSHELRTPLAAIKEGVALVADGLIGDVNEAQKECLETAARNISRLGRFINDVLEYQKLNYSRMSFEMKETDVNEVVEETRKALAVLARNKGLDLTARLAEGLPKVALDRDRIMQVLTNLLTNAIQFTEKGTIIIVTAKVDAGVSVCVQDTGVGIKKEDMARLFEVFGQIKRPGVKRSGTGLGLVISKKIIQEHGGRIWVESGYGKGSKFSFALPLVSS